VKVFCIAMTILYLIFWAFTQKIELLLLAILFAVWGTKE